MSGVTQKSILVNCLKISTSLATNGNKFMRPLLKVISNVYESCDRLNFQNLNHWIMQFEFSLA